MPLLLLRCLLSLLILQAVFYLWHAAQVSGPRFVSVYHRVIAVAILALFAPIFPNLVLRFGPIPAQIRMTSRRSSKDSMRGWSLTNAVMILSSL